MATLKIRKECLDSEVHYPHNGSSYKVVLKEATAEQLKILKDLDVDVFEKSEKEK